MVNCFCKNVDVDVLDGYWIHLWWSRDLYLFLQIQDFTFNISSNNYLSYQSYLHSKSDYHCMKNSIAYSQLLHLNKIWYSNRYLGKNCQKLLKLLEELTNRDYGKTETVSHINKAIAISRNDILNKSPTMNNKNSFDYNL